MSKLANDARRVAQGASLVLRHLGRLLGSEATQQWTSLGRHARDIASQQPPRVDLNTAMRAAAAPTAEKQAAAEAADTFHVEKAAAEAAEMPAPEPPTSPPSGAQEAQATVEEVQKEVAEEVLTEPDGKIVDPSTLPPEEKEELEQELRKRMRQRAVPSTPLQRVLGFGSLAAGLAWGTFAESVRRTGSGNGGFRSAAMSDANAERLASALSGMRGAALKLGQMLSIQDESVLPAPLSRALERVRSNADMMPTRQLESVMKAELGEDWRSKFDEFDDTPIAAASIGQVHKGFLKDGRKVAVKVQYPGVADSIDSDIRNLQRLLSFGNFLPPGLFIDEIVQVAKEELTRECDYEQEALHQQRFAHLIREVPMFEGRVHVPEIIPELCSARVLTSEFVSGKPVDQTASKLSQERRNEIAQFQLEITMRELFEWRFMQTDPNWGNYLYDADAAGGKGVLNLIDFGAAREFPERFVDDYAELVWAAANGDKETMVQVSKDMGFLTGDESPAMTEAHVRAGLVVGEPFFTHKPFDFHGSGITRRIAEYSETFAKHRLTPPPREAYSLHRKLAGAFLMCIKLKTVFPCRHTLERLYKKFKERKAGTQEEGEERVQMAGRG